MEKKEQIIWSDFDKIDFRCGEIVAVDDFPEARKSAYWITLDFGPEIGLKKSSAQITEQYTPKNLMGKQVLAIINFPIKQIGPKQSECLICGFYTDKGVVLAVPDHIIPPGSKLG